MNSSLSVVVVTRNRKATVLRSLGRLLASPEHPPVIVVDNGSTDGSPEVIERTWPVVRVLRLGVNRGGAARTVGVEAAGTPYVAFSDDDSWWEPGALALAIDVLDRHPTLALIAARILVGPENRLDPTCALMAASPLPRRPGLPGPPVLGFLACGCVVRRRAYLDVGGFEARYGIGGEEELLALDLAASGWDLAYCEEIIAHHDPGSAPPRRGRARVQHRNALWSAWLRRPWGQALRRTSRLLIGQGHRSETWLALADAIRGAGWVLRRRRPLPDELERLVRMLETAPAQGP